MSPLRGIIASVISTTLLATALLATTSSPAVAAPTSCSTVEAIAHRGFHTQGIDEETAAAFQAAIDGGFSVETDIWRDADGQLWFFHDRDVSRATDGTGLIDQLSTAYLESLHYTKAGMPLTTFEDGLAVLAASPTVRAYFEIKDDGYTQRVITAVVDAGRLSTTYFTSRSEKVHQLEPSAPLLLKSTGSQPPTPTHLQNAGISIVTLRPDQVTPALVDEYHAAGIEVQDRTSDWAVEWALTIASGLDGQLTNFPDQFKDLCYSTAPPPVITGQSVDSGTPGSEIVIDGSGFSDRATVDFSGVPSSIVGVSDTSLTAVVPVDAPGTSVITVTTPSGAVSSTVPFTVVDAPVTGPQATRPQVAMHQPTVRQLIGTSPTSAKYPDTSVRGGSRGWVTSQHPTFSLTSTVPGSSFTCQLDGKDAPCAAPALTLGKLKPGHHQLSVTAISPAGLVDQTPGVQSFGVPHKDSFFRASPDWRETSLRGSFTKHGLVVTKAGATLLGRVTRARSIYLIVERGHGFGSLRVTLGNRMLKTIRTDGKPGIRVVRLARFSQRTSGRLRIVADSDAPVRIDGIGIS